MKTKLTPFALLVALLALAVGTISAQAQDENGLMNIRIVTVKQDHLNDWIKLQKELSAAMKKAGAPGRNIYQVAKGDHNTFHILTTLDGWADYDENNGPYMDPGDWANWINKVSDTIQSRREYTVRTFNSISVPLDKGTKAKLVAVRRHTVKQGHSGDFYDWYEDKLVPAIKKLGVTGRYFGRSVIGDNVNTFYHARTLDSWADMGNWVFSGLSAAERADIFTDERQSWIVNSEQIMLEYREDLSFESED